MLQHAAHGQQSHGQHHQNHPNQHHPQQHSSYHLNPNNSNLIGGASDGGMFNDREAHSMLESVVKGNQNKNATDCIIKILTFKINTNIF